MAKGPKLSPADRARKAEQENMKLREELAAANEVISEQADALIELAEIITEE